MLVMAHFPVLSTLLLRLQILIRMILGIKLVEYLQIVRTMQLVTPIPLLILSLMIIGLVLLLRACIQMVYRGLIGF